MKNKRLYNYITNTFGLSKDVVIGIMNERFYKLEIDAKKIVEQKITEMFDSSSMKKFIRNEIIKTLEDGFSGVNGRIVERKSLQEFIKEQVRYDIKKILDEELAKSYKVKLTIKNEKGNIL